MPGVKIPIIPTNLEVKNNLLIVFVQTNFLNGSGLEEGLIKAKYLLASEPVPIGPIRVGTKCFVLMEDGNYYRGIIKNSENNHVASVYFTDYGNVVIMPLKSINIIDNTHPLWAVHEFLPLGQKYVADGVKCYNWTEAETMDFQMSVLYQKVFGQFRTLDNNMQTINILLNDISLSEYMIGKQLAMACSDQEMMQLYQYKEESHEDLPASPHQEMYTKPDYSKKMNKPSNLHNRLTKYQSSSSHTNPYSDNSAVNTSQLSSNNSSFNTSTFTPNDYNRSQAAAQVNQPQYDPSFRAHDYGNGAKAKEIDLSENLNKLQVEESSPYFSLPVDSTHQAIITFVEDGPNAFFLQIKASADRYLPHLNEMLYGYPPIIITRQLLPGTAVMGRSLIDQSLRRGAVVSVKSSHCQIYFTDYGTVEDLPYTNIFRLSQEADSYCLPLALRFTLAKLDRIKLTQQVKDYFTNLVLEKVVTIKIADGDPSRPHICFCDMLVDSSDVFETLVNLTKPLEYLYPLPPCEKEVKVTISYIENPAQFYIQYTSARKLLDEIYDEVEAYCKNKRRLNDINSIHIGLPVGCLFHEDNHWHRALVVKLDNDLVDVVYVDYGNQDHVKVSNLVELSRDLVFKWRTQAVECCLAGFENKQPSEALGKIMDEEFGAGEFNLKVKSMLFGNRLCIDLSDKNIQSISQHLLDAENKTQDPQPISQGATSNDNFYKRRESKPQNSDSFEERKSFRPKYNQHDDRCDTFDDRWNSKKDFDDGDGRRGKFGSNRFGDKENGYQNDDRNGGNRFGSKPNRFSDSRGERKPFRSDRPPRRDFGDRDQPQWGNQNEQSADTNECWDEPTVNTVETPNQQTYITKYSHPDIENGSTYTVHYVHMEQPNIIYVQMAGSEPILDELRAMLDADANYINRKIEKDVSSFISMPVLAIFPEDELLYRATVRSVTDQVKVTFVDYGNSSLVSDVFLLTPEMSQHPAQAIKIILDDILPTERDWPSDLTTHQNVVCETESLTLKVTKSFVIDGEMSVSGSLTTPEGLDVGDSYVSQGLARKDGVVAPVQSQIIPDNQPLPHEKEALDPDVWAESLDLLLGQKLYAKVTQQEKNTCIMEIQAIKALSFMAQLPNEKILSGDSTDVIVSIIGLETDRLLVEIFNKEGVEITEDDPKCVSPAPPFPVLRRKDHFKVVHIDHDNVYVQRTSDLAKLALLEENLNEYYNNSSSESEYIPPNTLVCCKIDGNWYRGKSLVDSRVKLLDYGKIETVQEVKQLEPQFYNEEFALCVRSKIKEGEFDALIVKEEKWVLESLDYDKRKIEWEILKGQIVPILVSHVESPSLFYVHLYDYVDEIEDLQSSITDGFSDGEIGPVFASLYQDGAWYRAREMDDKVFFIDYGNSDATTERKALSENFLKIPNGYAIPMNLCVNPINEWSTEAKTLVQTFMEHEDLKAEILTKDYKIIVDLIANNEKLSDLLVKNNFATKMFTEEDEVVISCFNTVNDFYVHKLTSFKDIEQLSGDLIAAGDFEKSDFSIGDLIAAQFPEDDLWYRALVVSKDPSRAFFVDYGNTSNFTEMRKLPEELAKRPYLALHCSLNIEENDDINEKMSEISLMGDQQYSIIYKTDGKPRIVDMSYQGGANILDDLIPKKNLEIPKESVSQEIVETESTDTFEENNNTENDLFVPDSEQAESQELIESKPNKTESVDSQPVTENAKEIDANEPIETVANAQEPKEIVNDDTLEEAMPKEPLIEASTNDTLDAENEDISNDTLDAEKEASYNITMEVQKEASPDDTLNAEKEASPKDTLEVENEALPNDTSGAENEALPNDTLDAEKDASSYEEVEKEASPEDTLDAEMEASAKDVSDAENEASPKDTLEVEKEALPNDTLDAEKEALPNDTLDAEKEASAKDTLDAENEALPNDTLDAEKDASSYEEVEKEASPEDALDAEKEASAKDTLDAENEALPNDTLDASSYVEVEKEASPEDTLDAEKEALAKDTLDAENEALPNDTFNAEKDASSYEEVEKEASPEDTLDAENDASSNDTVEVKMEASPEDTLDAEKDTSSSDTSSNDTLEVENQAKDTLHAEMEASPKDTLEIESQAKDTLTIEMEASPNNTIDIEESFKDALDDTFEVEKEVSPGGTLDAEEDVSLNDTLNAEKEASLSDTLEAEKKTPSINALKVEKEGDITVEAAKEITNNETESVEPPKDDDKCKINEELKTNEPIESEKEKVADDAATDKNIIIIDLTNDPDEESGLEEKAAVPIVIKKEKQDEIDDTKKIEPELKYVKCIVSQVESIDNIVVIEDVEAYKKIKTIKPDALEAKRPVVNETVLIKRDFFRRGKVISVLPIKVELIDESNKIVIVTKVYSLPESLNFPPLCKSFSLDINKDISISTKGIEYCKKLIGDQDAFQFAKVTQDCNLIKITWNGTDLCELLKPYYVKKLAAKPVKTVADIKSAAKSKIFPEGTACAKKQKSPAVTKRADEKILPGSVSGSSSLNN